MKAAWLATLAVALAVASGSVAWAQDPSTTGEAAKSAPDNTGRNVRDRGDTLTSGDQAENETDLELTQKIRQAIVGDDSLSMTAENVKIITANGVVTLRGPVESEAERAEIGATAERIAGAGNVRNHLEIAPED